MAQRAPTGPLHSPAPGADRGGGGRLADAHRLLRAGPQVDAVPAPPQVSNTLLKQFLKIN